MKKSTGLVFVLAVLAASKPVHAITVQYGWADEFSGGFVHVKMDDAAGVHDGTIANGWGGDHWLDDDVVDQFNAPFWSVMGQQTANAAGRANAREKVMVKVRDADDVSVTLTVNLARSSVGAPPPEGSSCTGSGFTASASQTFDSTSSGAENWKFNNRMLPVLDFSYETAGTTASIAAGYRTVVTATLNSGPMGSEVGCYSIYWIKP